MNLEEGHFDATNEPYVPLQRSNFILSQNRRKCQRQYTTHEILQIFRTLRPCFTTLLLNLKAQKPNLVKSELQKYNSPRQTSRSKNQQPMMSLAKVKAKWSSVIPESTLQSPDVISGKFVSDGEIKLTWWRMEKPSLSTWSWDPSALVYWGRGGGMGIF